MSKDKKTSLEESYELHFKKYIKAKDKSNKIFATYENKIDNEISASGKKALEGSIWILRRTMECVKEYDINYRFENLPTPGGKAKGRPSTKSQDLLRAMLVFSSAGLESTLLQLIRNQMPDLVAMHKHEDIQIEFKSFIERKIKDKPEKYLSEIFTSQNDLKEKLSEDWVYDLCNGSLQSKESLIKLARSLGIFSGNLKKMIEHQDTEILFKKRNNIIHEMDHSDDGHWKVNKHKHNDVIKLSQRAIGIASEFIHRVENLRK